MTCYPKISDWINDVFGTSINLPIQSFGFFVALAFAAGAVVLVRQLKRREREGLMPQGSEQVLVGAPATVWELAMNALLGFVLGYKIVPIITDWQGFASDPQYFLFAPNGSQIAGVLGALLLGGLKWWEKKKQQLDKPEVRNIPVWPHERIGDIVTVAAITGILGARAFSIMETGGLEDVLRNPGANFFSGLNIYGGLLVGIPSVIFYAWRKKINILHLGDAASPALMVAYGVGRMGCQVSGDGDWGVVNNAPKPGWLSWAPDWLWAYNYPNNVNGWCSPTGPGPDAPACNFLETPYLLEPVWPTPIYEIIMAFAIAGVLMMLSRRLRAPGMLFGVYFILNGIERFFIEKIRINDTYASLGGMTQAEVIAIGFVLTGIGLVLWTRGRFGRTSKGA
jgi:phosphatidylglycerol:prolipoprotein diacylglycerol transferase